MPTPVWVRSADELLRDMRGSRGLPSERMIHTPQHPNMTPLHADTRDMVDFLPLPAMNNNVLVPTTPGHWVPPSAGNSLSSSAISEARVATLQAELEQARREKDEADLQVRHKTSEQEDTRRTMATISKEKITLEQLHLEGQLENAGLRDQIKDLAEIFQQHIREAENTVCEHCPVLHQEIEAGRRECKKIRDQLEKSATATDAHRLRADLLAHDVEDNKTHITDLSNERGLLVTELEMQQRRFVEIEQQNADLRAKVINQDSEITHMTRTIKDLSTETSNNETEVRKLACEGSALSAEVSTLKTFNSQSQEQTRKLEGELRAAHERIQESEISRVQGYELKNKLHADMVAKEDLIEHLREKVAKIEKQKNELLSLHETEVKKIQDEKADVSSLHDAALTQVESKLRMIESLRAEMEMSEEELSHSRTSREALKRELAELSSHCKQQLSERETSNVEFENLLRDLQATKSHEETLKIRAMEANDSNIKKIRQLEDSTTSLASDYSENLNQVAALNETLREQQKQTEAALSLHKESQSNTKRIQSQLQSSKQEINTLQESLKSAHNTVATTQGSLKEATKELTAQHAEYLRDRKSQTERTLQLETELSASVAELQKATETRHNFATDLAKEREEVLKIKQQSQSTELEMATLRKELQTAIEKADFERGEKQIQSETLTTLQQEYSSLQRELLQKSQQQHESESERLAHTQSVENQLSDIKRILLPTIQTISNNNHNNIFDDKTTVKAVASFVSELDAKTNKITELTRRLTTAENDLVSSTAEMSMIKLNNDQLKTLTKTLESELNNTTDKDKRNTMQLTQELSHLQGEFDAARNLLKTVQTDNTNNNNVIESLRQENNSLRETITGQSETLNINIKTVEQLQTLVADKENEIQSQKQANGETNTRQLIDLQKENDTLKYTAAKQTETLQINSASVEQLQNILSERESEMRNLTEEREERNMLRSELGQARETIDQLSADYTHLQQKLMDATDTDSLRSRSASPTTVLADRTRQLKDDCLRFTNEIKRLREENTAQTKEMQFLKDVNTGLKKEMDNIIATDSDKTKVELELRRQTAALQVEVERTRRDMADRQIIEVGVSTALAKSEEEIREKTSLLTEIVREKETWKARAVESEDYITGIRTDSCAASELNLLHGRLAGEIPSPSQQILLDRCRTAADTVSDSTALFVSECLRSTLPTEPLFCSPNVVSPLRRAATPSHKQRLLRT